MLAAPGKSEAEQIQAVKTQFAKPRRPFHGKMFQRGNLSCIVERSVNVRVENEFIHDA
jgi:hypothetical protein